MTRRFKVVLEVPVEDDELDPAQWVWGALIGVVDPVVVVDSTEVSA